MQAGARPRLVGIGSAAQDDPVGVPLGLVDRRQLAAVQPGHRPVRGERVGELGGDVLDRERRRSIPTTAIVCGVGA